MQEVKQLNLNVTADFARDLATYMRGEGIEQKSEAVRRAVKEAAERSTEAREFDFRKWIGMGLKYPANPNPRFRDEDDLWS